MFKTNDLEKVLNYLKKNNIDKFDILESLASIHGPYGTATTALRINTNEFKLTMLREIKNGDKTVSNQVILTKDEAL